MAGSANLESLRKTYCPPLDDGLVIAIASDYDLTNSDHLIVLRGLLDGLNEDAIVNEAADASTLKPDQWTDPDQLSRTTPETTSESHNVTSATSDLGNLSLNASEDSLGEELEQLPESGKLKYLRDLFPGTNTEQVQATLQNAGSLRGAIDELLNIAFISTHGDDHSDNDRPRQRGIEGFAEDLRPERGRKGKKRRNRTNDSSRTNSTGSYRSETPTTNVWNSLSTDVDFICSRTTLEPQIVKSIYHRKGARLADTIKELADREKGFLPMYEHAGQVVQLQVEELRLDYVQVPASRVYALLHLARNIPSATWELLEAMTAQTVLDEVLPGKLNGVVQYAPVKIDESDTKWTNVQSPSSINYSANHSLAAGQAFGQASTAARRAKSDRLMGGAAAYYASVGHEHLKIAKAETAAAADNHVAQQSTRTMIDLHGVSVADAVRIANAKTQAWWAGLGDAKYVSGGGGAARAGFQIVTGVGTHSRNNAPRIGPAVAKALVREGWKVEVGHGEMYVTGKARK